MTMVIAKAIGNPMRVPSDAFEAESQAFRNCTTPGVVDRALHLDAVQALVLEQVAYHRGRRPGGQALPEEVTAEPVADLGVAILSLDVPGDTAAGEPSVDPYAEVKAVAAAFLLLELRDEVPRVG